jgi:hypothetical protein
MLELLCNCTPVLDLPDFENLSLTAGSAAKACVLKLPVHLGPRSVHNSPTVTPSAAAFGMAGIAQQFEAQMSFCYRCNMLE